MRDLQERRDIHPPLRRQKLRWALTPVVAAIVVAGDQVAKTWALHSLGNGLTRHVVGPSNFVLTYNTGAAFGLGNGVTPIVEAVVVILVVGLLVFSRRISRAGGVLDALALGLLLGGALSNLGDRVFRSIPGHPGAVVDFIQIVSWWPVFNIADAAIVIGVILLVVKYALVGRRG